jgi:hypothetical protein
VSAKVFTTIKLSFSPQGRIGGLSVLQTEAEVAASSVEKVVPDRKKAEATNVVPGKVSDSNNGGVFNSPGYLEKDLSPAQGLDSPQALFEATRGKVDALKQVGCSGRSDFLHVWALGKCLVHGGTRRTRLCVWKDRREWMVLLRG